MDLLKDFLWNSWKLSSEMAPYLLLGFLIAGLLRSIFREAWIKKNLGKRGFAQTVKSVFIGVPLPLCSCGVIPVAAGIRKSGGQPGSVAAFTSATPQTGVDSILATAGVLGWPFSIIRILIAFITGFLAGTLVDLFGNKSSETGINPEEQNQNEEKKKFTLRAKEGFRFGLITLPADLTVALVVGVLIAGIITTFAPPDLLNDLPGGVWTAYVAMTLIALPLYVCSTGSIPMAVAFIQAGMSPGAVLIFLIAGPATNIATITSLLKLIGKRSTLLYLASIFVVSWLSAIFLDLSDLSLLVRESIHHHEMGVNLFQQICSGILLLLLAIATTEPYWEKLFKKKQSSQSCCHH